MKKMKEKRPKKITMVQGGVSVFGKVYNESKLDFHARISFAFYLPIFYLSLIYIFTYPVIGIILMLLSIVLLVRGIMFRRYRKKLKSQVKEDVTVKQEPVDQFEGDYEHQDVDYEQYIDSYILKYEYKEVRLKAAYMEKTDTELDIGQPVEFEILGEPAEDGETDFFLIIKQFGFSIAKVPVLKERIAAMIENYIDKEDWIIKGNLSTRDKNVYYYHIVFYKKMVDVTCDAGRERFIVKIEDIPSDVKLSRGQSVRASVLFGSDSMLVCDMHDHQIGRLGKEDTQHIIDSENGCNVYGTVELFSRHNDTGTATIKFLL